jgi:HemY protein
MRAALWFVGLFCLAVAGALFAGNNQGSVMLFWPPYRLDLSLNMVVLLLLAAFFILYGALRGFSALVTLPLQAKRWRLQQRERNMHQALLESLTHLHAGRFLRPARRPCSRSRWKTAWTRTRPRWPTGCSCAPSPTWRRPTAPMPCRTGPPGTNTWTPRWIWRR